MKALKIIYLMGLALALSLTGCDILGIDDDDGTPSAEVGDTLWIHQTPVADSMTIISSLAIGQNGDLYYAVSGNSSRWNNARLIALDGEDGTLKWMSEEMDHATGISSEIVVGDDNTIYVIGFYTLYAFDPNSGSTKWTWEVPTELPNPDNPQAKVYTYGQIGALALTDDGNLILGSVGSGVYNRGLYVIDRNGNKVFHNLKAVGWGIGTGITIGKNNTAFYYSDINGNSALIAVNAATGNVKWTTVINGWTTGENNITVQDGGDLYCVFKKEGESMLRHHIVNATDGSILWSGTEQAFGYKKWIGPDGSLYEDRGPHKINPTTGERTLIVNAEMGAITENNCLITAFTDADRIRKLGVFFTDGYMDYNVRMNGLIGNAMAIGKNKVIYGIINEHPVSLLPVKICAIQGESPLASKGWPRKSHDNRNTSNIDKH